MMMKAKGLLTILALGAHIAAASLIRSGGDHPVEKVIGLLKDLKGKVQHEAETEEVTYAKFTHWCANSKKTLGGSIAEAKAAISSLQDTVAGKTTQAKVLGEQIGKLEAEITALEASTAAAGKQRETEASIYASAKSDYQGTIDAIKSAIAALKDSKAAGLLSTQERVQRVAVLAAPAVTPKQHELLAAFLQQRPAVEAKGDQAAHVKDYAFKSGGVIEMLKELQAKFEEELLAADKAETNALNAHSLAGDARDNAHAAASKSKDEKTTEKGEVEGELEAAKADLEETQSDHDADTTLLSDTTKQCALKASEWSERSAVRKGELEAMQKGIEILGKVTGVRTEPPSNPVPPASPVDATVASLLQLQADGPADRAVQLLRKAALESHSHSLDRLSQEIAAHASGPFDEVNNMIQKMIHRLMSEQTDEDNHKNWCDQELSKSNASKSDKEDKLAELSTKMDLGTATIAELTSHIKSNSEMLASIEAHMNEATEIRQVGKEENAASIKDSKAAQAAIADATAVLEQYYKESGMVKKEAWELLQQPVELPAEPSTWDAGYTGVADPKEQPGGIITVLKTLGAEFGKMEADTRAQEETDLAQYKADMKACKIEKARREKESDMKSQEKKRTADKVASLTKNHKQVSSDHEAVVQYLSDLEPACVEGDSTYEDRKAARAKEIEALHQAQGILAGAFAEQEPEPKPAASFLAAVRRH